MLGARLVSGTRRPDAGSRTLRGQVRMAEATTELQDEVALVQAARAGDRFAFGQLYQRYGRMVHGILLSRVPPGAVDDLVQDVFLKAMVQLHHLRDDDKFGGWI